MQVGCKFINHLLVTCSRAVKSDAKERAASFPQIERVLFSLGLFYFRDVPSHKYIKESESNITHLIRVIHREIA